MRVSIERTAKHAILAKEEDLRSLFSFLSSTYRRTSAVAQCLDGSRMETENVEEIVAYDNATHRRIISATIEGYSSPDDYARLEMAERPSLSLLGTNTATINVVADSPDRARDAADGLMRRVRDLKPAYEPLTRFSVLSLILVLWGAFGLARTAGMMLGRIPHEPGPSRFSTFEEINITIVLIAALYAVTYPLDLARRWLYPRTFFAIGRQREAATSLQQWRLNLFWGGIAAIAVAVLVAKYF